MRKTAVASLFFSGKAHGALELSAFIERADRSACMLVVVQVSKVLISALSSADLKELCLLIFDSASLDKGVNCF